MRSGLALGASAVAALAAIVAQLDGDRDIVPFFVGLSGIGLAGAWATREPMTRLRATLGQAGAFLWLGAAVTIGALLVMYQATCGCSYPERPPEATFLGLTATVYHLAGVYLGGALMAVAAFSRALGR